MRFYIIICTIILNIAIMVLPKVVHADANRESCVQLGKTNYDFFLKQIGGYAAIDKLSAVLIKFIPSERNSFKLYGEKTKEVENISAQIEELDKAYQNAENDDEKLEKLDILIKVRQAFKETKLALDLEKHNLGSVIERVVSKPDPQMQDIAPSVTIKQNGAYGEFNATRIRALLQIPIESRIYIKPYKPYEVFAYFNPESDAEHFSVYFNVPGDEIGSMRIISAEELILKALLPEFCETADLTYKDLTAFTRIGF